MDIRDWPLDRIMQLPDCAFGRRWPIFTSEQLSPSTTVQWFVRQALPERIVIWQLVVLGGLRDNVGTWFKLALGDVDPATPEAFAAYDSIFGRLTSAINFPLSIVVNQAGTYSVPMRFPIVTMGRRFCVEARNGHEGSADISLAIVISSIPREVPDCLLNSEYLRSR